MKLKINIREFIENNASTYGGRLQISAEIELDDLFSSIPEEEDIDVDIHELLAENRQIAHIWGIDDVQEQRPDLDDDQAWAVLQVAEKRLTRLRHHWDITDHADGYGQGEVINRLRDMAELLAKDMPDVKADVDPGSVQLLDHDETTSE